MPKFQINPDGTTNCPVCGSIVHPTTKGNVIYWLCECGEESIPERQWDNIKFRILNLVREELESGNTMSRWLLGRWLVDLGTLLDDYPEWLKIVDAALDMIW